MLSTKEIQTDVFWGVFDLDMSRAHAPTAAHHELVPKESFFKQGQKPDRPVVDGGMVDRYTAFLHHFPKIAVAQRIGRVPVSTHQNSSQLEIVFF